MLIAKLSLVAVFAFPAVSWSLVAAAPALADCTTAADITICSPGPVDVEVSPMPYMPYPCEYDWYCGDGGVMSLMYDPSLEIGQPGSGGLNSSRDLPGGSYTDD